MQPQELPEPPGAPLAATLGDITYHPALGRVDYA
jgi:hypothetical protein